MPPQPTSATASPERPVRSCPLDGWKTEFASGDAPERDNTESPFLLPLVRSDPPCTFVSRPHNVQGDRKSTRLNSSHVRISYAVFCLKKKKTQKAVLLAQR